MARNDRMDTIVSLCKRRGFVFPSSEIYGGLRASWDYGPLGVEMKNNIKRQWWKTMVQEREDIVGLDSSVILAREVWEASGHVTEFVDPLTECQSCHKRFRADHLIEAYEEKHGHPPEDGLAQIACPNCGTRGAFTEPRMFNGLLRTYLGAGDGGRESGLAYLRPETAQGIFINYRNVLQSSRKKIPFGIGQIGKSFRNEITPGNFIFRMREFEQMEMEFFVKPGADEEVHQQWIDERLNWHIGLGVSRENLRLYEHPKEKLSHYSKRTVDIEYKFDFPGSEWAELEGIANRTDFDLTTHGRASGQDMSYLDPEPGSGSSRTSSSRRWASTGPCWSTCSTHTPRTRRRTRRATWRSARCSGSTRGSPRSRWRCCRCPATRTSHPRPVTWPRSCASGGAPTSTTPAPSAAATAVRTRSAPRSA